MLLKTELFVKHLIDRFDRFYYLVANFIPNIHYLEDNNEKYARDEKKQQVFSEPGTPVDPVSKSHHFHGFFQTILFLKNQLLTIK